MATRTTKPPAPPKRTEKLSLLDQERAKFMNSDRVLVGKRKRTATSEDDLLSQLRSFRSKVLQSEIDKPISVSKRSSKETELLRLREEQEALSLCALHNLPKCSTCFPDLVDEEEDDGDWMTHYLHFTRKATGVNLLDHNTKRNEDIDNLVVIDPRARMELAMEKTKQRR